MTMFIIYLPYLLKKKKLRPDQMPLVVVGNHACPADLGSNTGWEQILRIGSTETDL